MTKVRASQSICQKYTQNSAPSPSWMKAWVLSQLLCLQLELMVWDRGQISSWAEFFKGDWSMISKVTLSSKVHWYHYMAKGVVSNSRQHRRLMGVVAFLKASPLPRSQQERKLKNKTRVRLTPNLHVWGFVHPSIETQKCHVVLRKTAERRKEGRLRVIWRRNKTAQEGGSCPWCWQFSCGFS